jgi:flagellar biosynthesis/type III secretory pathway chaperone
MPKERQSIMNNAWELIAHCLRDELQEYGGLLGRFQEQQDALLRRDPAVVLGIVSCIEEQARSATLKRERRETVVREFALRCGKPADSTLRSLLGYFPAEVRPMLEALIDEVNRLVHRARRTARQNALMLQRAIDVHQEALRSLRPESFTKTYSPKGQVTLAKSASAPSSALQAVG